MKINWLNFTTIFSFFSIFFSNNLILANKVGAKELESNTSRNILKPCKDSAIFEKRLNASIKKFENRLKLYDENTPQHAFLMKEIALTKTRFESYKNSSLYCGKDGLPHLITTGDFKHFNEFGLPGIVFLYITGWIGWAGRKYLQYASSKENSFETEIIIDVPIAFPIIISGFLWPVEAWKEFISGKLIVVDDEITVSPR